MTALSPMGRVPQRRPVPARIRPHRRAGPWLAFLGVLVVIAVVVWWQVLGADTTKNPAADGCGPKADQSVAALDPKTVKVRVYNATERTGLAKQVADGLKRNKFTVVASSNDPLADTRKVEGVGEIRYGSKGEKQALLLSFWFPGIQLVADPRGDAAVDVAVGPTYKALASAAQIAQSKKDAAAGTAAGTGSC
jgi:hypothetical protein